MLIITAQVFYIHVDKMKLGYVWSNLNSLTRSSDQLATELLG